MYVAAPTRVVVLSGIAIALAACGGGARRQAWPAAGGGPAVVKDLQVPENPYRVIYNRSEERRVGKEWRSRWSPHHLKKKHKKIKAINLCMRKRKIIRATAHKQER